MNDVIEKTVKLHGDASYRVYSRVFLKDGTTKIIMQMPQGKSSASEEITNFKGPHKEPPFININRFLASLGLPVPKIYRYDKDARQIILEDIGNDLLIKFVENADNEIREKWYEKAIDLMVEMQRRTALCAEKEKCVAMQRSFDATLLNWEFDHFREYLIEERQGKKMATADRRLFEEITRKITKEILKVPYCFTHRDFQSKNLMVRGGNSFVLIDFQDALLGPCVYDLVALLRDSYVELDWEMVEKLVEYYCKHNPHRPPLPATTASAGREKGGQGGGKSSFHLVTLQRKMKDAGRFVYIDRVKKNPNFLRYIPTTLKYIKNAFEQANILTNQHTNILFEMLKTYVPEFKTG